MALSNAVLSPGSTARRIELPTKSWFAGAGYIQSLPPLVQGIAEEANRTEENATRRSKSQPDDLMSAALPRVFSCVEKAGTALTEKRIADLCAHLEEAAAILQALVDAAVPAIDDTAPLLLATPVTADVVDGNSPGDAPALEPAPSVERLRAMAAVA